MVKLLRTASDLFFAEDPRQNRPQDSFEELGRSHVAAGWKLVCRDQPTGRKTDVETDICSGCSLRYAVDWWQLEVLASRRIALMPLLQK